MTAQISSEHSATTPVAINKDVEMERKSKYINVCNVEKR